MPAAPAIRSATPPGIPARRAADDLGLPAHGRGAIHDSHVPLRPGRPATRPVDTRTPRRGAADDAGGVAEIQRHRATHRSPARLAHFALSCRISSRAFLIAYPSRSLLKYAQTRFAPLSLIRFTHTVSSSFV